MTIMTTGHRSPVYRYGSTGSKNHSFYNKNLNKIFIEYRDKATENSVASDCRQSKTEKSVIPSFQPYFSS